VIRATLLLPLALLASLGPSVAGRPVSTAGPKQADAALAAFEAAHPKCEVWSNWQKMCSRIGSTVHCTVDRVRPVRPSAPFCLGEWEEVTPEAYQSQMRFCRKTDVLSFGGRRVTVCERYQADRPFNGRRLQPRLSPACEEWREESSNRKARAASPTGYYCARYTPRRQCNDYSYRSAVINSRQGDAEGIIAGYNPLPVLDSYAVHGLACGDKK
jgi:hypothetical protein